MRACVCSVFILLVLTFSMTCLFLDTKKEVRALPASVISSIHSLNIEQSSFSEEESEWPFELFCSQLFMDLFEYVSLFFLFLNSVWFTFFSILMIGNLFSA